MWKRNIWQFIKYKHEKKSVKLLESVLLWVAGMLTHTPTVGGILTFVAIGLLLYNFIPWDRIHTNYEIRKWSISIGIIILLGITPLWGLVVSRFPNDSTDNANAYIRYIGIHQSGYSDGILVELGSNYHDIGLDANIALKGEFVVLSEYWDTPHLDKPSENAQTLTGSIIIEDKGGKITLGKAEIIRHDTIPPVYDIETKTVMVTPSRSYYVVFVSNDNLQLDYAHFGDTTLD